MKLVNPTQDFYGCLDLVGERFNIALFDGKLPKTLFTLRSHRSGLGHFVSRNWTSTDRSSVGEIALNPNLFAQHSWLDLFKVVAQSQCDLWQHVHGKPSRPGYKNAQWAQKMREIGLIPSSTGRPGGRQTGQGLSSYPLAGGLFVCTIGALAVNALKFPVTRRWLDNHQATDAAPELGIPVHLLRRLTSPIGSASMDDDLVDQAELREQKRKIKYTCPACDVNVWGRTDLRLLCAGCGMALRQVPSGRAKQPDSAPAVKTRRDRR